MDRLNNYPERLFWPTEVLEVSLGLIRRAHELECFSKESKTGGGKSPFQAVSKQPEY